MDQRRAIEKYARNNGYEIIRHYEDDAISGVITERRDAFLRMLQDADSHDRNW